MSTAERNSALKKVYWLERDGIALATRSENDNSTDYVSVTEAKTVHVHAVKRDSDFVASGTGIGMTQVPSIPTEFHEALAYYAIARGYETNPKGLQQAMYFRGLFNEEIREAKKYANKQRDGSGYHIQQHDF